MLTKVTVVKIFHLIHRCVVNTVVVRLHILGRYWCRCGPGISVGIATDYGPDGPGSNPGGDEIFCPSRLALGSTQPPVKWVSGLSRG